MTKTRNSERALMRKEQSNQDRIRYLSENSVDNQAAMIQNWQSDAEPVYSYTGITLEFIDIAACFITGLLTRKEFTQAPANYQGEELSSFQANVNFVRKSLSKAQINLTSLVCCLYYIDQYCSCQRRKFVIRHWTFKELFTAAIIVAEKYVADDVYLNTDWAEWTEFEPSYISRLEFQFLQDINFTTYIPKDTYDSFFNFLMISNNKRQGVYLNHLSYRKINMLTQWLSPIYLERLDITLRPFDALVLMAKAAAAMCVVYAAAMVTIVYASYVIVQNAEWFLAFAEKNRLAMMIMSGVDLLKYYERRRPYTIHSITTSCY